MWAQWPCSMWDLSSPTRDQACALCIGRWNLNYWTTGEVFFIFFFLSPSLSFFIRAHFKRYNSSSPSPHCRSQVQEAGEAMKNNCGDKVFFNVERMFYNYRPESSGWWIVKTPQKATMLVVPETSQHWSKLENCGYPWRNFFWGRILRNSTLITP